MGPAQPAVLIVDDSPENLTVLGELLSGQYLVRAANSGERALALVGLDPRPDIILLDVMMPAMDGYCVIERLRQDPATRDIPVIFVTAMDESDDEARGLALGAVDYITKPVRPAIVLARVKTHLELKRARDRMAAHNASLEAAVQRHVAQSDLMQQLSIQALRRLAETRDNETGAHLRRTQEYVRTLAVQLRAHPRFAWQLDEQAIDLLARCAPLHDIGKVGIPDRILLKPGKLTGEEWLIMKSHVQLGASALEHTGHDARHPIAFLRCAREIALHHHERWDGTGYPDGLAGDAIPMPARLMALADVFDALITPRVYKPAMGLQAARDVVVAERGLHFDPDVVDAFVACYPRFCEIARHHAEAPPVAPAMAWLTPAL